MTSDAIAPIDVTTRYDERADGAVIATVTVSNPARLNCLSSPQIGRLSTAFNELSKRDDVRAAILTGAGARAFIGGADLNELGGLDEAGARDFITGLHLACRSIQSCPIPVIARINGFCLGAGLEVAASCDIRVAAEGAVLGMPEVHMGLPSVIEAALLPGLIGWGRTRELLITGRTLSATEALAIGLVERVAPAEALDAAVGGWLDDICRAAPRAVRAQKALMATWQHVSLDQAIRAGIDALADAYSTGEPAQRIGAFLASRKPH
ncbi:MAG: enoyl-CoA hydratase [Hyphomicrobiaceae bacterium]